MSFDDKLDRLFLDFKLTVPNTKTTNFHLYADYVELISLFSNDSFVTKGDIIDRLLDLGIEKIEEESVDEGIEIGSTASEQYDKVEDRVNQIFSLVEERFYIYGCEYPFDYSARGLRIKSSLEFKHRLYLYLLVGSNLNMFKAVQGEITTDFETVSYHALQKYLPEKSTVKNFGKSSDYSGNAKDKIRKLAKDLNIAIDELELENISEKNNQERGLDLIGWIRFDDIVPNILVILGQCACGKEWHGKSHDTRRFKNYFKFYKLKPLHSLFIPYSLINYQKSRFYNSDEILDDYTLLFERKRIMEYFNDEDIFNALTSKTLIDRCISYEEDIV
uniref:hypothetical protein n=1 Tax=Roseivirga sp. TaxID=1964215 RepID=UPI004047BE72